MARQQPTPLSVLQSARAPFGKWVLCMHILSPLIYSHGNDGIETLAVSKKAPACLRMKAGGGGGARLAEREGGGKRGRDWTLDARAGKIPEGKDDGWMGAWMNGVWR